MRSDSVSHNLHVAENRKIIASLGKLSQDDGSFDRKFWSNATPAQKVEAIFQLRDLYHEVMHPEIGAKRLDRSIGGLRRLSDPSP